jgi:cytochrome c-type biogenesis protein
MNQLLGSLENLLSSSLNSGSLGGALIALALAYVGGVLSSLTPCIYPMIPITVGVVGGLQNKHEKRDTKAVLIRGLAYVLGMAIIYAFLGVLAGITGQVFGTFTNTAGWYITLGIIMTLAALNMIDVLPFDPQAMIDRFKRSLGFKHEPKINTEKEATLAGAFLLGASSGFIAAPCTTPVLTAILGFIAQTQSVIFGLGLMLFFAFGLGTILILIAAFAGSLQKLPRAGNWMNKIKIFSGILILAFAEYLIFKAGKIH